MVRIQGATASLLLIFSLNTLKGVFAQTSSDNSTSEDCASFGRSLDLPNVSVDIAEFVPNGTNLTFPYNNVTCGPPYTIIYGGDICRLAMTVNTSDSSRITLEAWLPPTAQWNGRFLSTGNGGISGCIQYGDIAYANSFGFAAVGANNGHNGTGGTAFAESSGVVEDFAWRSVYTGAVLGKNITSSFYGEDPTYSYYLGCSTGGRQGMKMAQNYPDTFDGIVAGAPAFDFNGLQSWSQYLTQVAGYDNTSSSFVTVGHWALVAQSVLSQCDALDGAEDGILEDPDLCYPTFTSLLCSPNATNTSTCLNSGQLERVNAILSPFYGLNGTLVYPRMQPGAELAAYPILYAGNPFPYATDWMRYVVYNDSTFDPKTTTLEDVAYAEKLDPFGISTWSGNLSEFSARGSKLLTYHGLVDPLISSDNSARYYTHLATTMGLPPSSLDEFYRYFRISGMGHCGGGIGAADIGQGFNPRPQSAEDNVLLAVMNWVENGTAPEFIRGYSLPPPPAGVPGPPGPPPGTPIFTRKHCKYPARNVYLGPGNVTDEDAWQCITEAAAALSRQT
ncbi:hypothetical protein B0A52_01012 [Exophiala mesophila]|uniref:Carboxylic ester hydrolase n=1 Tax=Exophiala mesophila TaxID=212818 RepID=A0A438NG81_EXOME|nr:hypothetical protein B0A52_01012 [Exophiala mesophila]